MRKIKNIWKILFFAMILFIAFLCWFLFIGFELNRSGGFYNKGLNAVWIEHTWVDSAHTDQEVNDLVNKLKKYQINTVFVHVGPLEKSGAIPEKTYEFAMNFLDKARRFDENIQYQAWMGQLRNKIDLDDGGVRKNIAKQAMIFTKMVGFDGVHIDIEPVWDGDEDFIKTIKEIREIIGNDKKISVALAEFIPQSVVWLVEKIHKFENYNTEINYENVANYADQIVVMAYDTGINNKIVYKWLIKEQIVWLTRLLDDKEILMGLPAYEDENKGFNPEVENIKNGLNGIVKGLNDLRSKEENFTGVAIYPFWEMDLSEWGTYEELWLSK